MRHFTETSPITYCFESKLNPLIKIDCDRNISFYSSISEKLGALKNRHAKDKFIIPWGGKWSTDVFELSEIDINLALIEFGK